MATDMRLVAIIFTSLMMDVAEIGTMGGCAPTTAQARACPPGAPWVPDDYANGKWVPGHCLGQPAQ
jgi:hypothetical protein